MADANYLLMSLKTMPQRMQDGKDFSKGLRQAQEIVNNPDVNFGTVKKKSAACANLYSWLEAIVHVGNGHRPTSASASPSKSQSPPKKQQ